MADTIQIELIDNATIKTDYPYWNIYPLVEKVYKKGKNPIIYRIELEIDTSTANTATESTKPTNLVNNFTTPQQVFIRSSNAADTSKNIDVIGQKADGSFGQFTLTSDASDGTTPVDVGTWNFIAYPIANDTWAGNLIIDNDGIGGTVFWTLALGVSGSDGIVVIPNGYKGSVFQGVATLTDIPAANANGNVIAFGPSWNCILTDQSPICIIERGGFVAPAELRVQLLHFFKSAVTVMNVSLLIVLWEE